MWKVRWLYVAIVLAAFLGLPAWVQGKALDDRDSGAAATHGARLRGEASRPHALADAPWETNVIVNDDLTQQIQAFPSIAVDTSLNAYAAWEDYRNGKPDPDIYFSYRPAGGPWGANVRVNDDAGTLGQLCPSIAVDAGGNAYVVWVDWRSGDNPDIFFSYRPNGGSWGANVQVNDDVGTASQGHLSLAVDPDGNAYALWEDFRNGHYDIYFSYRPSGGAWGANVRVNDDTGTEEQWHPSISVDHGGNAYAVWADRRDGVDRQVYFSYRPAGGSWSDNVMVIDDAGEGTQGNPIIAADPSGNAYAVWEDGREGNPDIYSSYRPSGGAWGANVRVNDDASTEEQEEPFVAVDSRGNAYAVWHDWRNGEYDPDIYFSSRPAAGSWSANVRVNDDAVSAWQFNPTLVVDSGGSAYALWEDNRTDPPYAGDIYFSYLERQAWLGDRVWHDADQDGLQEAGEPGVQGILVTLYATGGCTGPSLATENTDSNGHYLFTSLPASTYCLRFSNIAPSWTISPRNRGPDDTVDSDADPSTVQIQSVILAAGSDEFDQDVGVYEEGEFVPEPGTAVMLAAGLAGLGGFACIPWARRQLRRVVRS